MVYCIACVNVGEEEEEEWEANGRRKGSADSVEVQSPDPKSALSLESTCKVGAGVPQGRPNQS